MGHDARRASTPVSADRDSAGPPAPPWVDVAGLQAAIARFARERDWEPFHSPKNLAMALTGEVGELVEIFQWLSEDASRAVAREPGSARRVRDELADVLIYLVRLAAVLEVDLDEAVRSKLAANAQRYPVERARGHARKSDLP
ncbi:MAG: nucleotide pyrophosphohydrolase [Rubrivivax sp.]|nr:nucleotide pyrophosphohydrolase [Rubrivivax sp.]